MCDGVSTLETLHEWIQLFAKVLQSVHVRVRSNKGELNVWTRNFPNYSDFHVSYFRKNWLAASWELVLSCCDITNLRYVQLRRLSSILHNQAISGRKKWNAKEVIHQIKRIVRCYLWFLLTHRLTTTTSTIYLLRYPVKYVKCVSCHISICVEQKDVICIHGGLIERWKKSKYINRVFETYTHGN